MKEEEIIRQHDSGRRPFTTPDGYFDSFSSRLMRRMEKEGLMETATDISQTRANVTALPISWGKRFMRYAAVAVIAAVIGGSYLYQRQGASVDDALASNETEMLYSDEMLDYELDYEMVNNNQIAYYLTEAY